MDRPVTSVGGDPAGDVGDKEKPELVVSEVQ